MEKVVSQAHPLRHIQILNPSRGPDWGLFSFCFKGRWPGHPPFGDWTLDAERVCEPNRNYQIEDAGTHADGTPLLAIYVAEPAPDVREAA